MRRDFAKRPPVPVQEKEKIIQFKEKIALLTQAERSVLKEILALKSKKQIALERGRGQGTIRVQANSIYQKLGIHSRAELILFIHESQLSSEFGLNVANGQLESFEKKFKDLPPAEIQIIDYLVEGYNPESIANNLGISQNTVITTIRSIFIKLKINSTAELITFVISMKDNLLRHFDPEEQTLP